MKNLIILGDGQFAREVYWHVMQTYPFCNTVFADDYSNRTEIKMGNLTIPVIKDWRFDEVFGNMHEENVDTGFIVGVGQPQFKRDLIEKAQSFGLKPAATIIHPRALVQGCDCEIGVGGIIAPGTILTTNVKIGNYVVLNLNVTVGHDVVINDYATCNPGCHISGEVVLGQDVSLGTGTTIRQGITIAEKVVTGAQACVVKNIEEPNITVTGVPAKKLK